MIIRCPHCKSILDLDDELYLVDEETEIVDSQAVVTQLMKCRECKGFFNRVLKSEDITFWHESIELL